MAVRPALELASPPLMRKLLTRLAVVLALLLAAIQLVPVERTNPPIESEIDAPAEVLSILRRACYDCHSNATRWPWYTRIAPASWLVARDVREGREELNFSTWGRLDAGRRAKLAREVFEEASEGEMPPWFYLPLHPEAHLSQEDLATLGAWARAVGGGEQRGS